MKRLLDASRQSDVTGLINRFLASNEVQGIALGVHDVYVSMHRSQFRKDATVSEILESPEQPAEWAEVCRVQGFSETLSPVFVVIYVTSDPDGVRMAGEVPDFTENDHYQVVIEKKGPFVAMADRTMHRPILGGISVGNAANATSGTLGGFLKDRKTSTSHLFSCSHVLDNASATDVTQRGRGDGGISPVEIVASSLLVVPLTAPSGFTATAPYNKVDAAAAEVSSGVGVNTGLRVVGAVQHFLPATSIPIGQDVVFVGKESDRREARTYRLIARLKVLVDGAAYLFGDVFEIESRQPLYISTLSQPGDSGSWVLDEAGAEGNELYGVLFAGYGSFSVCCFMEYVLDALNALGSTKLELA